MRQTFLLIGAFFLLIVPAIGQNANPDKPILMPYNRSVKSAGKVLTYGDPHLENHTLDLALLPDRSGVVIEDRYGIAVVDAKQEKIIARWTFQDSSLLRSFKSTFSGIKAFHYQGQTCIVWGAATQERSPSGIMVAYWANNKITRVEMLPLTGIAPSPNALPNEIEVVFEKGECFLYTVLNGNEQVVKIRFRDRQIIWTATTGVAPFGIKIAKNKVYISNWGGPQPTDPLKETAGVPFGSAYTDPRTGAIAQGTVSVFDTETGQSITEIQVGLHPNAMVVSPDEKTIYVANGNSDNVSVIDTKNDQLIRHIPVGLFREQGKWVGSSPNGLAIDSLGQTLYVSNGLDHALAVVRTGENPAVVGFIPTEAYPSGVLLVDNKTLWVANLEARGAAILNNSAKIKAEFPLADEDFKGAYNAHEQYASFSIIPVPSAKRLSQYTKNVEKMGETARAALAEQQPRPNMTPVPVPERIGEPSVFKHVIYIIKENRTYDQVYGDLPMGRGMPALCVFGDSVTPNQHQLARTFALLDNYHVSGKSSAEGHQWTDASIVSDSVEKNVRAWFRSYPHRQYDAMVYTQEGFIWNHALDHGKSVRIYGEACFTEFDEKQRWNDIYQLWVQNKPFALKNTSTISRVRPILSQNFPGYDNPKINDQLRADAFIRELKAYEAMPGDSLPQLMVMALPNDHTAGTDPGYPTTRAMVADNDLALGKIIDAVTHSRFWESTVIFVTEDDTQGGWDHRSAYRTGALVISPYSAKRGIVRKYYNQTSMLRTIEQILGVPPMNIIDATAEPMFSCFNPTPKKQVFTFLPNRIPLDEMNKSLSMLEGKALFYAQKSSENTDEGVDTGNDDLMNRIIWFSIKGDAPYPGDK